jgi:hypothetical protein
LQVLERENHRLGAGAGHYPGNDRRQLALPHFFRGQRRRSAGRQGDVERRGEEGRDFIRVDVHLPQGAFQFRQALLGGHVCADALSA